MELSGRDVLLCECGIQLGFPELKRARVQSGTKENQR
jgi:hypothetical protein